MTSAVQRSSVGDDMSGGILGTCGCDREALAPHACARGSKTVVRTSDFYEIVAVGEVERWTCLRTG